MGLMWLLVWGLFSCNNVTLVVRNLPENTPAEGNIFVAGNFNHWNPSDKTFILEKQANGFYTITLPRGIGFVDYKFTRGDWKTVEQDACGQDIDNRSLEYGAQDSVFVNVESWADVGPTHCPHVTVIIDKLPATTPSNAPIYMASNFNDWGDADKEYQLVQNKKGQYYIRIPRSGQELSFKFTRGSWDTEEVNQLGETIENRNFMFGKTDTLRVRIDNWKDLKPCTNPTITIMAKIPANTPRNEDIYMACDLNGWNLQDPRYKFVRQDATHCSLTLANPLENNFEYKITRGSWDKQEATLRGEQSENRKLACGWMDTLNIEVLKWYDMANIAH